MKYLAFLIALLLGAMLLFCATPGTAAATELGITVYSAAGQAVPVVAVARSAPTLGERACNLVQNILNSAPRTQILLVAPEIATQPPVVYVPPTAYYVRRTWQIYPREPQPRFLFMP